MHSLTPRIIGTLCYTYEFTCIYYDYEKEERSRISLGRNEIKKYSLSVLENLSLLCSLTSHR